MRRWIKEDNRGVSIVGIRWLLREDRRGQEASSLVIYSERPGGSYEVTDGEEAVLHHRL